VEFHPDTPAGSDNFNTDGFVVDFTPGLNAIDATTRLFGLEVVKEKILCVGVAPLKTPNDGVPVAVIVIRFVAERNLMSARVWRCLRPKPVQASYRGRPSVP
jgi:hypothetical protein